MDAATILLIQEDTRTILLMCEPVRSGFRFAQDRFCCAEEFLAHPALFENRIAFLIRDSYHVTPATV
jgi:hypothetical protein